MTKELHRECVEVILKIYKMKSKTVVNNLVMGREVISGKEVLSIIKECN